MTFDGGFAPNPFHGFLTLAICKPRIRRAAEIGDLVAGFTSKTLNKDEVGSEKLIYMMKIKEIITFEEYWNRRDFNIKKPSLNKKSLKYFGDNIYEPLVKKATKFNQFKKSDLTNFHKEIKNQKNDIKGKNVLIAENFIYFGINAIEVEKDIRPEVPRNTLQNYCVTDDVEFIKRFEKFVLKESKKLKQIYRNIFGLPHHFKKLKC